MTGRLLGGGDVRMGESSADWRRRIGYAVVHGLVLLAVLAASPPHNSGRSLLLAAAVSTASFLRLQGSDPGFLTEEMLVDVDADDEAEYRRERIKQLEAALGEQSDATDQSDCSGEGDDALVASLPATAFCADCGLLPPLRAHHCHVCRRCVATFDHHCLLLGTCVGERNRARFWWFLLLQSAELALAIRRTPFQAANYRDGAHFLLLLLLWTLLLFAFGLWCFHTFLALTNSTTWEIGRGDELSYLRGVSECGLPFSRGLATNLRAFGCCSVRLSSSDRWRPTAWPAPHYVERNSTAVCQNLWENRYYSCC